MEYTITRRRKKLKQIPKERTKEEQELINEAKALLMERNNLSEEEGASVHRNAAWIMEPG